ncbi:MAG TPA: hypothetical protein VFY25_07750, partial [Anaerolineales bacterium]|nr:hypothetical protein [Anaerolineales bacterium]
MVKPPQKFNPTVDKVLVGGLGCGLITLCFVISSLVYIWQNPPRPGPTSAPTQPLLNGSADVTPGPTATPLFQFATPSGLPTLSLSPTIPPTEAGGAVPGLSAPSPVPNPDFAGSPPRGHIVYTCYVNQIDQICLMNADGSERRQLTDFEATSFYASISPEGGTIYFSSRQSGSYEIYSVNLKGRGLRRLTGGLGSVYAPERSPNNDRVIFANEADGVQRIWIMRSDGNN